MKFLNLLFMIVFSFLAIKTYAESDPSKLTDMSIEELMNLKVTVASKTEMNLRETPGVVSVITHDEIENVGARDLKDALTLLVPGFQFSTDVEGTMGPNIRGIYSIEGKVLVLIDGIEMNERVFGTTLFDNHFLLDNVERIEIIRGPGSVIYGGFGEMAVINMITRDSSGGDSYVGASAQQSDKKLMRKGANLGIGTKGENWKASISAQALGGNRSDRDQSDFYGNTQNVAEKSEANAYNVNGHLDYKDLDIRIILDHLDNTYIDLGWLPNLVQGAPRESYDTQAIAVKYDWKLDNSFILTPSLEYKEEKPYVTDIQEVNYTNHKSVSKSTAKLNGLWTISEKAQLLMGLEYWETNLKRTSTDETFKNGTDEIKGRNTAAFTQLTWVTDLANVIGGVRYDSTNEIGSATVPRLGLTKIIDSYNVKLIASQAFRTPGGIITNRSLTTPLVVDGKTVQPSPITPEKATTLEAEFGWQVNSNFSWTTNIYSTKIENTIVYIVDPLTGYGYYNNYEQIGTVGLESTLRYKYDRWSAGLNYAYYQLSDNAITAFDVPGESKSSLGAANNRLNAYAGFELNDYYSINPSVSYFGERFYVYPPSGTATDTTKAVKKVDPVAIVNVNFRIQDKLAKNLELDLGVNNIFDTDFDYLPGYYWTGSANPPLRPGSSREYNLKLSYHY